VSEFDLAPIAHSSRFRKMDGPEAQAKTIVRVGHDLSETFCRTTVSLYTNLFYNCR